jgi:hypothetical protein
MMFLRKKEDPISERAKALNSEIAALEQQIRSLNATLADAEQRPRLRSSIVPGSQRHSAGRDRPHLNSEAMFEELPQPALRAPLAAAAPVAAPNQVPRGPAGMWQRLVSYVRGPGPKNPKFLSLLSAGTIEGLPALRYEKRVARYRLMFLCVILLCLLWIIVELLRSR